MDKQTAGIHIKAPPGRGAYITNVTYRNIHLKNVRQCILVGTGGGRSPVNLTKVSGITFENVRCEIGTTSSYDLSGDPTIEDVRFINVTMAPGVMKQAGCHGISCSCDALTDPCPSCCQKAEVAQLREFS